MLVGCAAEADMVVVVVPTVFFSAQMRTQMGRWSLHRYASRLVSIPVLSRCSLSKCSSANTDHSDRTSFGGRAIFS